MTHDESEDDSLHPPEVILSRRPMGSSLLDDSDASDDFDEMLTQALNEMGSFEND